MTLLDAAHAREHSVEVHLPFLQEALDVGPDDACGCVAVSGLLWVAQSLGLRVRLLDLRDLGDTAGPRDQVVGYGALAVG